MDAGKERKKKDLEVQTLMQEKLKNNHRGKGGVLSTKGDKQQLFTSLVSS